MKLSNGDYNVHYIGVNWPHHVFLNQNFKVIAAEEDTLVDRPSVATASMAQGPQPLGCAPAVG